MNINLCEKSACKQPLLGRILRSGLVVAVLILPLGLGWASATVSASPLVYSQLALIEVGQGDATLLSDGAGFNVLVDGGPPSAAQEVLAYLAEQQVTTLQVMVATHADRDHIAGLTDVLESDQVTVAQVVYNGYPGDTDTWDEFVAAVEADGLSLVTTQAGEQLSWGDFQVHVLNPPMGLEDPEQNRVSIVLAVTQGEFDAFLPGDIDAQVEAELLDQGVIAPVELLKVAHHGSQYSTSAPFLNVAQPEQAVISVGSNPYGHPSLAVLERLRLVGAHIWRTDQVGTVWVRTDGVSYWMFPDINYLPITLQGLE